jgi:hypothetical protein
MLKILIVMLGADYDQWLALTRVALKLDLRADSYGRQFSQNQGSSARQMVSRVLIYVVFGIFIGILTVMNKDVLFTGGILVMYTMMMVAMLILIDFGAIVLSPDDYAIMGYQPVSSRTYFIARLTNVLVYSTLISLALGIIPVIAFCFTLGVKPLLGLAALLAVVMGSITTTLFLIYIYAGILRVIHPNKLKRIMGYIQMAMSFFFTCSYLFMTSAMQASLSSITLTKKPWFFFLPPAWFASYLSLATGNFRLPEIAAALFSFVLLTFLLVNARGKLALDYADQLSSAMAVSEGPKKISKSASRRSLFFGEGESRAIALLVRNQFKYDQKFKFAVLGILPMSIMYLFMALRTGPLVDPFIVQSIKLGNSWLLYYAVLLFPIMLNTNLSNSDSYQASWIYFATPADCSQLVVASKGFVFAYFETPYLMLLGAIFLYYWGNLWHVLTHIALLALLSHIFLQFTVMINPVLPFSMPSRKGQRSKNLIFIMILTTIAAVALIPALLHFVYPNPLYLFCTIIGLVVINGLLEIVLKRRVEERTTSMEYQG